MDRVIKLQCVALSAEVLLIWTFAFHAEVEELRWTDSWRTLFQRFGFSVAGILASVVSVSSTWQLIILPLLLFGPAPHGGRISAMGHPAHGQRRSSRVRLGHLAWLSQSRVWALAFLSSVSYRGMLSSDFPRSSHALVLGVWIGARIVGYWREARSMLGGCGVPILAGAMAVCSGGPASPNFGINPAAGGTAPAESPRRALARRGLCRRYTLIS